MKRSEFLRLSLLASIGLAIAPSIALPQLPKLPEKKFYIMKVSAELMRMPDAWERELKLIIKDVETRGNIVEHQIGWMDDDFARNLYTIQFTIE